MKHLSALSIGLLLFIASAAHAHDCEPPATACKGEPSRTVSTPAGESVSSAE
jgi:hypothetical protein